MILYIFSPKPIILNFEPTLRSESRGRNIALCRAKEEEKEMFLALNQ